MTLRLIDQIFQDLFFQADRQKMYDVFIILNDQYGPLVLHDHFLFRCYF